MVNGYNILSGVPQSNSAMFVAGLEIDPWSRGRMDATLKELLEERDGVKHLLANRDIGRRHCRTTAARRDRRSHFLQAVFAAGDQADASLLRGQDLGQRPADAARGPRDDHGLVAPERCRKSHGMSP